MTTTHNQDPSTSPEADIAKQHLREIREFADQLTPTEPADPYSTQDILQDFGVEGTDHIVRGKSTFHDAVIIDAPDGESMVGVTWTYESGPTNASIRNTQNILVRGNGAIETIHYVEYPDARGVQRSAYSRQPDANDPEAQKAYELRLKHIHDSLDELVHPKPRAQAHARSLGGVGLRSIMGRLFGSDER